MTGSLSVTTTGTELQVNASGVNIGNALTDNHIISGSVRINPNGLFVSSSGNVGIGTTSPNLSSFGTVLTISASSGYGGVEVYGSGSNNGGQIDFGSGNIRYASVSGEFESSTNGFLNIRTRRAGTMENAVRITSAGNVGIGTTSPGQLLEVVGGEIKAGRVDSSNEGGQVSFGRATDNATAWYIDAYGNVASPQLRFVDVTGGAVRMTLTGSNVGIGTSTPVDILHIKSATSYGSVRVDNTGVNGGGGFIGMQNGIARALLGVSGWIEGNSTSDAAVFAEGSGNIRFYTNGSATEKMRITSGGDVLMGNTDGSGKLVIAGDDNNYILRSRNTSAGGNYQFYIQHSLGNVSMGNQRGTVAYNNSSDYRLKEDLKPFNGLDILSNIIFYDFKWKESQIRNYGIIAHELQEVIPYLVEGNKDELFEDGSIKSQQVDITKLIPILGKAIQEQQAKITALEEILQRNNIQ
jgi:hypothetical protein